MDITLHFPVPHPDKKKNNTFKTYIKAQLFHRGPDLSYKTPSTKAIPASEEGRNHVLFGTDAKFEWEFDRDDMAFVRFLVMEDEWGKDDRLAVFCSRLDYIQNGWRLVRLLDMKGKESGSTVLVKFTRINEF
jgi:phosphatidylinositol phospholipase C delta